MPKPCHFAAIALVATFAAIPATAQQSPTRERKGFNIKELGRVDLGAQIPAMAGYLARMTYVTVDPGGFLPMHSHSGRPEILYLMQGALTEVRNGQVVEHAAGAVLLMTNDVNHSLENKTAAPAVYIAAPISKPQ